MPLASARARSSHSVTVYQIYLCKLDGDDAAFVERGANDLQVFRREATADVKDQTLFSRMSVDSARHWLTSVVHRLQGQTACHSNVIEKSRDSGVCGPANLADLVNVVKLAKLVGRQRNLNCVLSIPNALMRCSSVEGGIPSLAAAPEAPEMRPRDAASAASMLSRSLWGSP